MSKSQTYLLVGNVTRDLLPDNRFTIGGTVTYASVVARNLGWQPVIVTAADSSFTPPAYLADVDWRILPSPHTLTFRNEYDSHGNRRQTIGPLARGINPEDIPPDCRNAPLVHLCPLAQELEPEITSVFQKSSLLVATPQGWMRQWNQAGTVFLGEWDRAAEILPTLRAAVISLEDVEGDWSIARNWADQVPILIVTLGKRGASLFYRGQQALVPPRPAHPVDPTGAGDVFAAAFFIRYQETADLWQSVRFANVTASMAIERPGPQGSPLRHEVDTYLAQNPAEPPPGQSL